MKLRRRKSGGMSAQQVIGLLERQRQSVIACLMKRARISREAAIDLMYTAMAELVLRFRSCRWPRNVRNWGAYLVTVAWHTHIRPAHRDEQLLTYYPPIGDDLEASPYDRAPDPAAGPAFLAERRELVDRVRAAIGTQDILRQTALLLWSGGYSGAEIAGTLKISAGHARVLKYQALRTLKVTLKKIA